MKYKDGIKTAVRHAKEGSHHIVESMANQVRMHEGERAAKEFRKEAEIKGKEQRKR
jgi:hypothetical protein